MPGVALSFRPKSFEIKFQSLDSLRQRKRLWKQHIRIISQRLRFRLWIHPLRRAVQQAPGLRWAQRHAELDLRPLILHARQMCSSTRDRRVAWADINIQASWQANCWFLAMFQDVSGHLSCEAIELDFKKREIVRSRPSVGLNDAWSCKGCSKSNTSIVRLEHGFQVDTHLGFGTWLIAEQFLWCSFRHQTCHPETQIGQFNYGQWNSNQTIFQAHPKIDPSMWQSWWRLWGVGQRAVGRPVGSAGAWCFCSLRSCGANVVLEKHPTEAIKCDSYWVWTRHRSSVGPYSSLLDSWSKEVQLANFRVEDTPIQKEW